jgi:hypothetical protein
MSMTQECLCTLSKTLNPMEVETLPECVRLIFEYFDTSDEKLVDPVHIVT